METSRGMSHYYYRKQYSISMITFNISYKNLFKFIYNSKVTQLAINIVCFLIPLFIFIVLYQCNIEF